MKKMSDLQYHIGLVVRFYPDDRAKKIVAINDGIRRSVYNHFVAYNDELWHLRQTKRFLKPVCDRIDYLKTVLSSPKQLKNVFPYMNGELADSSAVDNAISNYNAAWNLYRKNPSAGIPTFKKKGYDQHYQTSNHYKGGSTHMNDGSIRIVDAGHVVLPIIGTVKIRGSRKMIRRALAHNDDARIGTVTISKDATDRYYLSIAIASDMPFVEAPTKTGAMSGYDVNLTNLYTDSDGNVCENPKVRRNFAKRLARAERKLSLMADRAKKDKRSLYESRNYQKQRKHVADMHRYLKAVNDDYLDVQTRNIVENQDYIFVEDIKVKNLLKNHKLAYAISDVSWGRFFQKLEYKAKMYDKVFLKVPARNTTQTCNNCGHVCSGEDKIVLGVEEWTCPECGALHGRDHNSAKNILASGLEILGL